MNNSLLLRRLLLLILERGEVEATLAQRETSCSDVLSGLYISVGWTWDVKLHILTILSLAVRFTTESQSESDMGHGWWWPSATVSLSTSHLLYLKAKVFKSLLCWLTIIEEWDGLMSTFGHSRSPRFSFRFTSLRACFRIWSQLLIYIHRLTIKAKLLGEICLTRRPIYVWR